MHYVVKSHTIDIVPYNGIYKDFFEIRIPTNVSLSPLLNIA